MSEQLEQTTIEQRIIDMAAEQTAVARENITRADSFVGDLGYDSLDVAEFVMNLEEAFDLSVSDEEVADLPTVGQVIDYVSARVSAR